MRRVAITSGFMFVLLFLAVPEQSYAAEGEWTVLMYYAADNDLESNVENTLSSLEDTLNTEDVKIVVMVDRLSISGIDIYAIEGGESTVVAKWAEENTSDPSILEAFVEYGKTNYPSDKTMLIIKGLGLSWRGICLDETSNTLAMLFDGMAEALEGKGIDLLLLDSEKTGLIEVAYELRNAASYLITPQAIIQDAGMPHGLFISNIVENPTISVAALANDIVSDYSTFYMADFFTISVCNMAEMAALGEAYCHLTDVLETLIGSYKFCVAPARDASDMGAHNAIDDIDPLHDLYTFYDFLAVEKVIPDKAFQDAIEELKAALADVVVAEAHSHKGYRDVAHGLSFFFPPAKYKLRPEAFTFGEYIYEDCGLDIVEKSSWVECLEIYFSSPLQGAGKAYQAKGSQKGR